MDPFKCPREIVVKEGFVVDEVDHHWHTIVVVALVKGSHQSIEYLRMKKIFNGNYWRNQFPYF